MPELRAGLHSPQRRLVFPSMNRNLQHSGETVTELDHLYFDDKLQRYADFDHYSDDTGNPASFILPCLPGKSIPAWPGLETTSISQQTKYSR